MRSTVLQYQYRRAPVGFPGFDYTTVGNAFVKTKKNIYIYKFRPRTLLSTPTRTGSVTLGGIQAT